MFLRASFHGHGASRDFGIVRETIHSRPQGTCGRSDLPATKKERVQHLHFVHSAAAPRCPAPVGSYRHSARVRVHNSRPRESWKWKWAPRRRTEVCHDKALWQPRSLMVRWLQLSDKAKRLREWDCVLSKLRSSEVGCRVGHRAGPLSRSLSVPKWRYHFSLSHTLTHHSHEGGERQLHSGAQHCRNRLRLRQIDRSSDRECDFSRKSHSAALSFDG